MRELEHKMWETVGVEVAELLRGADGVWQVIDLRSVALAAAWF